MSFRDIKRAARREVHETMRLPASLYRGTDDPVVVNIRLHGLKAKPHGDLVGIQANYAEMQDANPTIVAWREDGYIPLRADVLCFATGEAYQVDNVRPPDDVTVTAEVTLVGKSKLADYLPPEEI